MSPIRHYLEPESSPEAQPRCFRAPASGSIRATLRNASVNT